MQAFVKVMKALSDPNRIAILKMLQRRKMCVREIQNALQIPQPNVSKHLKVLGKAGLVESRKDGLWVHYRLSDGKGRPYVATVLNSFKNWLEDEKQIVDIINKLPAIQRETISSPRQ